MSPEELLRAAVQVVERAGGHPDPLKSRLGSAMAVAALVNYWGTYTAVKRLERALQKTHECMDGIQQAIHRG